jgi:hypothetical protein
LRGEVQGLLRRAALTVDRDARYVVRQTGSEPARSCDVTGLRTDRVETAKHNIFDGAGIKVVSRNDSLKNMGAEVCWMYR